MTAVPDAYVRTDIELGHRRRAGHRTEVGHDAGELDLEVLPPGRGSGIGDVGLDRLVRHRQVGDADRLSHHSALLVGVTVDVVAEHQHPAPV